MPGIRRHLWDNLYDQIGLACKNHPWELIVISPYNLTDKLEHAKNCRAIRDFGWPSRCYQLGLLLAQGELTTWVCDDAFVMQDTYDRTIELLESKNPAQDIIIMRYSEHAGHNGPLLPDGYWTCGYHNGFKFAGSQIDLSWKIPIIGLMNTKYERWLGGIDCAYETINQNRHCLAFRAQRNGSQVWLPDFKVLDLDHHGETGELHAAVWYATQEVDAPRFEQVYSQPIDSIPIRIDLGNWRQAPSVWKRRFAD